MPLPDVSAGATGHISHHNTLHNWTQADNVVRYVSKSADASDSNDGLTPFLPFATIQAAYNALPSTGGTVYLGEGTYDVGLYSAGCLSLTPTKPLRLIGTGASRGGTTTGVSTWALGGAVLTRTAASYGTGITNRALVKIDGGSTVGRGFVFDNLVFEMLDPTAAGETCGIYINWTVFGKVQECKFWSKNAVGWGIYATSDGDHMGWRIRDNYSQSCGLYKKVVASTSQGNQTVIDGNMCHLGSTPTTTNNFIYLDTVARSSITNNNFEGPSAPSEMTQACVYYTNCSHNIQTGNGGERTQIMAEVADSYQNIFSDVGCTPVSTTSYASYKLAKFTGSSSANVVYPRGFQGDDGTNVHYTSPIDDTSSTKRNWYLTTSMEAMDSGFTMIQRMPYNYVGKAIRVPSHNARRGALYQRTDGTTDAEILYVNKSSGIGTTWIAVNLP